MHQIVDSSHRLNFNHSIYWSKGKAWT